MKASHTDKILLSDKPNIKSKLFPKPYFLRTDGFSPLSIQIVSGGMVKSWASVVKLTKVVEELKNLS